MITITKQQALMRWDTLPDSLREALYSEPNSDFIWSTCRGENVPEQKIYDVARIAGYVLLGFLHPEDVGQELMGAIAIDAKTAKDIQDALIDRIFSPLRADIDKAYAPLSKSEVVSVATATAPKIIQDVSFVPPKPAPLPNVGWSKMSPSAIASVPMPAAPRAAAEPAPMILHEDTSFKAAEKNASFTLARPSSGADVHINQAPAASAPARPAVLEFGGIKPPAAAVNKTPTAPAANVIRYADTGPRSVSQITPPAPAVPQPPAPPKSPAAPSNNVPMPPTPPQPPSSPQANKPIVKDFL
jgi:hypothetical protein